MICLEKIELSFHLTDHIKLAINEICESHPDFPVIVCYLYGMYLVTYNDRGCFCNWEQKTTQYILLIATFWLLILLREDFKIPNKVYQKLTKVCW